MRVDDENVAVAFSQAPLAAHRAALLRYSLKQPHLNQPNKVSAYADSLTN